jgi:hypothetical protein
LKKNKKGTKIWLGFSGNLEGIARIRKSKPGDYV